MFSLMWQSVGPLEADGANFLTGPLYEAGNFHIGFAELLRKKDIFVASKNIFLRYKTSEI